MRIAARYLDRWRNSAPPGVGPMLRMQESPAHRVHRRVLLGYGAGPAAPALWPAHTLRRVRWVVSRPPAVARDQQERFAAVTGVPPERQESRLAALHRLGIPAGAAYRLGLLRDGWRDRWVEYVYDHEIGWNVSVGGVTSADGLRLLGDKAATRDRLAAEGIETVPHRFVPRGTHITDGTLREWLDRAKGVAADADAALFAKPVNGSQGDGAFVIRDGSSESPGAASEVTPYQQRHPVADPAGFATRRVAERDYLVQPLLRTHSALAALAADTDVVTVRVVTRDFGAGPRVFSTVIEVPLPPTERGQFYCLAAVSAEGTVGADVQPPWSLPPSPEARRVAQDLWARDLPDHTAIRATAVAAHRQFAGVFAIAWDIAVTDVGPVVLEGNGGFGTLIPQWVAGGLLCDLR